MIFANPGLSWLLVSIRAMWHNTLCSEIEQPLLFSCITLRKSNQFE